MAQEAKARLVRTFGVRLRVVANSLSSSSFSNICPIRIWVRPFQISIYGKEESRQGNRPLP